VWAIVVVLIVIDGSYRNWNAEYQKRVDLEAKTQVPDLVIYVPSRPEVYATSYDDDVSLTAPKKEGIYIFIKDVAFVNRSMHPLSLVVSLRIFLGDDMETAPYLTPKQDNIPFPGMETFREKFDSSIGPHLGNIISVLEQSTTHGYLSYFIDKYTIQAIVGHMANAKGVKVLQLLKELKKDMVVFENISGQSSHIAFTNASPFSFRSEVFENGATT
jgi:hypothetical protein